MRDFRVTHTEAARGNVTLKNVKALVPPLLGAACWLVALSRLARELLRTSRRRHGSSGSSRQQPR
jgi:hypothetical protein